jgi:LysR family transcriptional regulator, cyn operon transcriptional activator
MDLHQLRIFVAIADNGGVARAAVRVNLSQPAASRQIQGLEAELGMLLFDRIGRRMRLTSEGEDLLPRARRLVAEAQSLRERARALQSGQTGQIKIGATPPMIETVLAGFLAKYRRRHPGIEIAVVEDGGAGLIARLAHGEVHLAYVPVGDARFSGRLLYPIQVIAVLPEAHALGRARCLDIAKLAGEPLLVLNRSFASRQWFDAACQTANIKPNVRLESSAPNAVLGLAEAGYGIAILPSMVRFPRRGVRPVPLVHRHAAIGKWTRLAWDPRRFLAPYVEAFREALVDHAQRAYPGRALIGRAPPLARPAADDAS